MKIIYPIKGKYYSTHKNGLKKEFDEEYVTIINDSTYLHYYKKGEYEYTNTSQYTWDVRSKEKKEFVIVLKNFKFFYSGNFNQDEGTIASLYAYYVVEKNQLVIRADMESTNWDFVMPLE